VKHCTNCLMPSTRPRITFDANGVCNACQWSSEKKKVDWSSRNQELINIISNNKTEGEQFDVLVPVSGGKDSCYVSWNLKHNFGLTPLLVHIEPPMPRVDGNKNLDNLVSSGFDCLKMATNSEINRKIAYQELKDFGDPLLSWMISVRSVVFRTAINYKIKLVMWGEDGEVEYGGLTTNKDTGFNSLDYHKKVYLSGNDPAKYLNAYTQAELTNWLLPSEEEYSQAGIKSMHYNYFDSWDPYKNFEVAKKYCGFEESESRNSGTYTNFAQTDSYMFDLHCFLMYLKFGFGRCTADACIDIRRGALDREQAISLVKMFDDISNDLDLTMYAEYFECNIDELKANIYKHTNLELFDIDSNNKLTRKFDIR
jgi:N-acetyl sugar amidotransferase